MLEFILWSSRVGAQDSRIRSQKSRLRGVMSHSWLYTWFFRRMAATMPWVSFWSFSVEWLWSYRGSFHFYSLYVDGYAHVVDLFHMIPSFGWLHPCRGSMHMILFLMDSCTYTMDSCIVICLSCLSGMTIRFQICTCMFELQVLRCWYSKSSLCLKSFMPSLSALTSCFRGHLLQNNLSLSYHSRFLILENLSSDYFVILSPWNLCFCIPWSLKKVFPTPFRTFPENPS